MAQLQMFSVQELATMRDRTRSRNYSAERDQFRRVHARHRDWGKAARHAATLYRQFHAGADPEPPDLPDESPH